MMPCCTEDPAIAAAMGQSCSTLQEEAVVVDRSQQSPDDGPDVLGQERLQLSLPAEQNSDHKVAPCQQQPLREEVAIQNGEDEEIAKKKELMAKLMSDTKSLPRSAGFLSRRLGLWVWPLVRRGEGHAVEAQDLPLCCSECYLLFYCCCFCCYLLFLFCFVLFLF
ncbi:unnamed protein product [Polarella glacialis]|uniref:Uncharacterized protein n=1 Tax=Polarella glacialis TaxID=89957 RepID=A0A813DHC4_POLGL|nr:unnamed protein product [Polarella glacialis]